MKDLHWLDSVQAWPQDGMERNNVSYQTHPVHVCTCVHANGGDPLHIGFPRHQRGIYECVVMCSSWSPFLSEVGTVQLPHKPAPLWTLARVWPDFPVHPVQVLSCSCLADAPSGETLCKGTRPPMVSAMYGRRHMVSDGLCDVQITYANGRHIQIQLLYFSMAALVWFTLLYIF